MHKNILHLYIYRFILLFKHQSNNCTSERAEKKIKRLNYCTMTYIICASMKEWLATIYTVQTFI